MKVEIAFRHMEPSEALKQRVQSKLDKIDRYFPRPVDAHVVLSAEKHRHRAEVSLTGPHVALSADAETDDLYRAIDQAADSLERQVKEHQDRRRDHHKQAREVNDFKSNLEPS